MGHVVLALPLILVATTAAWAADNRPSENDLFGGGPSPGGADAGAVDVTGTGGAGGAAAPKPVPAAASPPAVPPAETTARSPAATGGSATARDTDLLGDPNAGPRLSQDVAPDDPLKIGGQLYLRALSQAAQGQAIETVRFSAPALVDAYFDARPNDRVRGFVLGRLFFDPTLPTTGSVATVAGVAVPTVPLVSGAQGTRGPTAVLDQMWLRFDIERTVFVTVGRQHVKWGTGRFWTPTDYLHPQRRNPVAAFDARPGFTMLKVHAPWEDRGWNFYGFALVEGTPQLDSSGRYATGSDRADTLGQIGTAGRAEFVLGTAELGLDAVAYRGHKPRFGGDLSFGIGDFDLYVDAGLRYGSELPHRIYNPDDVPFTMLDPMTDPMMDPTTRVTVPVPFDTWVDRKYPVTSWSGVKPQVTLGGTYSLKYNDNDVFTMTGEYFYNSSGYNDPHAYPGLFLTNTFEFFYTGRHYAAVGAIAAAPWSWNYTTFSLTTLGNLSDQSFITRLDYSLVLLTHLRFEAFGAVNYGRTEGEFRLGVSQISIPADPLAVDQTPRSFSLAPQAFSLGVGLRISI